MKETIFISDLHLSIDRPQTLEMFLNFLSQRARGVEALYILGDLFEAYIGDDDLSKLMLRVQKALKDLNQTGTRIFFQHGNRDFLLGARFCRETGVRLLDEWAVIDLYGQKVLITHGDLLCTDDLPYQAARLRVRNKDWQADALSKPLWMRRLYARWYRLKSAINKSQKQSHIMDANADAVISAMRNHAVSNLIHGHTHRPAVHEIQIDGNPAKRFVLSEWGNTAQALCWHADGSWKVETLELQNQ